MATDDELSSCVICGDSYITGQVSEECRNNGVCSPECLDIVEFDKELAEDDEEEEEDEEEDNTGEPRFYRQSDVGEPLSEDEF